MRAVRERPSPAMMAEHRLAEWEEWGRTLDRHRPYDPVLDWLDEHPLTLVLLVGAILCGLFPLLAIALW